MGNLTNQISKGKRNYSTNNTIFCSLLCQLIFVAGWGAAIAEIDGIIAVIFLRSGSLAIDFDQRKAFRVVFLIEGCTGA